MAELFQQQGNLSSVANGSVRSGKRAAREHKLTVGFQVSSRDRTRVLYGLDLLLTAGVCFLELLPVPSVPPDADGHPQQHHSSLRPLHQAQRSQTGFFVRLLLLFVPLRSFRGEGGCTEICCLSRFDPRRTVQQLRACGVLETIRISAAGYPSRSWPSGFSLLPM